MSRPKISFACPPGLQSVERSQLAEKLGYERAWDFAPDAVASVPGGAEWHERVKAERPEGERHLVVHRGHLSAVTDRDADLVSAAGKAILDCGWTGDRESIAARMDEAGEQGITEVIYTPAGPDVPAELEAFAAAAQG
jgi:5,10-methylenetetrahydromethanopterin reductase